VRLVVSAQVRDRFLSTLNRSHALAHDKNKPILSPTNEPTNEQNGQRRNDRFTVEDAVAAPKIVYRFGSVSDQMCCHVLSCIMTYYHVLSCSNDKRVRLVVSAQVCYCFGSGLGLTRIYIYICIVIYV